MSENPPREWLEETLMGFIKILYPKLTEPEIDGWLKEQTHKKLVEYLQKANALNAISGKKKFVYTEQAQSSS